MALTPTPNIPAGRFPAGRMRQRRATAFPTAVVVPPAALGSPLPPGVIRGPEESAPATCTWLTKYAVREPSSRRRYHRLKRLTDVCVVLVLAPVWMPLLVLVAALIAVSSPGAPVVFRQHRTGRGMRRFVILKFRTMVPNAEELKAQLAHLNLRTWPDFKVDPDPRVTAVGRFLRKTSLDELPQLVNVLRGDMSLVGPRPTSLAPDRYEPWQLARFEGPSGLTGVWQVAGRAHPSFAQRIHLDLAYLERACWRLDMEILLRTVPQLLMRKGA